MTSKNIKRSELENKILNKMLLKDPWITERNLRSSLKRNSSLHPVLKEMVRKGLLRTVKKKGFKEKFYRLGWNGKRKKFNEIMKIKEKQKRKRKLNGWHKNFQKGRSKTPVEKEIEILNKREREKLYKKWQ